MSLPTKQCTLCGETKPLSGFWRNRDHRLGVSSRCKDCTRRLRKPPTPEQRRRQKLRNAYGITPEDFSAMLDKQGGVCAACGTDEPGGRFDQWHVDHCHETDRVRGLLCHNCNIALGHAKDSPERLRLLIQYLEKQ